ncbi:hypothetical protein [Haliscomenobacter sp.]|uniref:hypothetical protein n=1 Tax=Haliscomenobacter sp. TaxID=2717303 RepID=UPI003BABE4FE
MKNLLLMLLLLGINQIGLTQESNNSPTLPRTGIKTALLGSLIYPGLKVGVERPYKIIQVDKEKKWGIKTILKERYLTANLGYYYHPNFHDNLYLLLERQKRRQHMNGWFTETAPGIGFSRTFLGDEAYAVSDEGQVDKLSLAGHNYALVSLSVGLGYNFEIKLGQPLKIYTKASLLGMFPSNSDLYLRPTIELGVAFSTSSFLPATPKLLNKHKTKRS